MQESRQPLWDVYDLAILDLDGVVYIGPDSVPGAAGHLERAAAAGMHLAYVTNNASRPPTAVADHLIELGIRVDAGDVVTAAQAAARLLAERLPQGAPVFVIGGDGLFEALDELGLRGVQTIEDEPAAVVSGYHPDVRWQTVIDGAILVKKGVTWVASNTDMTVPTPVGPGPGNGVLVEAVARFAGRQPEVAGKPRPPLFQETQRRVGGRRPLVVGDRLDTDVEGAANVGFDSLLVMTGVTHLDALVAAAPSQRPTYVSHDLEGLGRAQPVPDRSDGCFRLNGWNAEVRGDILEVRGHGELDDWWRVVASVGWHHLDTTGRPPDVTKVRPPGSVMETGPRDARWEAKGEGGSGSPAENGDSR